MLDKAKLFVVSAISREGIAEDLNEFLDLGIDAPSSDDRIKPDDDRLTDEICVEYARKIGETHQEGWGMIDEAEYEEKLANIKIEVLAACGIGEDETKEDE
jgi:hypothetical protein